MNRPVKTTKKYKRKFNSRLIKYNRTYSIQKIIELFGVSANTVNAWFKSGLKKIDGKRPVLVFAQDLIDFINARNGKNRKKCAPNEMFCCKCQLPRKPVIGTISIVAIDSKRLMTKGVCSICGAKMNKGGTASKLEEYQKAFKVLPVQDKHLLGCGSTTTNVN